MTSANHYGCSFNGPHGGSAYWCDGSVQGYDAVYQQLTGLTPGSTYNINFWLGDNSGSPPNQGSEADQIDMLVYAGDQLPIGTIPIGIPEPATFALVGLGMLGVGFVRIRRHSS